MIESAFDIKYKAIFFDIFDTILFRKIEPEYVKKIWAHKIIRLYNLNKNSLWLYNLRAQMESLLCQVNLEKGFDNEFVYEELIKKLYEALSLEVSYLEFYNKCLEFELTIEKSVLYCDEEIINNIIKLKQEGKKIYCISDMYFSKQMIQKIFKHLKVADLFDDIFVSSEYLINKKTAKLYQKVLEITNYKTDEVIMIGDNYHSDYNMPKEIGIDSIFLDRTNQYDKYKQFKKEKEISKINQNIKRILKHENNAFTNTILPLYIFIEKLYFNLVKDGFSEVFFLAREGEYLKVIFDKYVKQNFGPHIKSHYLYASRKATYLPSLKPLDEENFENLFYQYSNISIMDFLKSLNFQENEILNLNLKMSKDEMNKKVDNLNNSSLFKELLATKKFKDLYEEKRLTQQQNFKDYIKEMTNDKKIALVDVGWKGSIQNNIQAILGDNYDIKGYYFGLRIDNPKFISNKVGLIFSDYPVKTKNYPLYSMNVSSLEILLDASHGSTSKYEIDEKTNQIRAVLFHKEEEKKMFDEVISYLQIEMTNKYEDILDLLVNSYYDENKLELIMNQIYFKIQYKPTKEQIDFYNNIYHYENFGVFKFVRFDKNKKISFQKNIKENINFFVKYKKFFDDVHWPILKLWNEKLYIPKIIYVILKKISYKKKGII